MEFQYIFNILVVILFIFIIFKKSNENFSNISKQDLEGVQNIASMYKNGELKVAKLHVTDNAQFDKNIKVNEYITSKHLHINDHASTRRLDIRNDKTGGHPTHFNHAHSGTNHIRGNTHSAVGKLHCDNLHVNDHISTKRLDIRNVDGSNGNTHFNYNNTGINYLRGKRSYFDAHNWMRTGLPNNKTYGSNEAATYMKNNGGDSDYYVGFMRARHGNRYQNGFVTKGNYGHNEGYFKGGWDQQVQRW
jgi:hypothetical protein